jgi:adenosylmethionine-8-amino-7-oxononanoate aminotransferase
VHATTVSWTGDGTWRCRRDDCTATMADQAATVAFTFRNQFSNVAAEKLARKLCELAPGDLDRAFFVNSGSKASEYAIRMSLHYWKERGHAAPELATLPRIERFPTTEKR